MAVEHIKLSLLRCLFSCLPLAKISKQSRAQHNPLHMSLFKFLNTLTLAHTGTEVDAFCERLTLKHLHECGSDSHHCEAVHLHCRSSNW